LDGTEAELRHDLAHVLRDEAHEVNDMLGFAGEFFPQPRVLRRHAGGAGIEMADAHHDAPDRDERRRRKAKLLGAEEGRYHDVAARLELSVRLYRNAAAEIVEHQSLMCFCNSQLPRQ